MGRTWGTIENSFSKGTVDASYNVGGLVGVIESEEVRVMNSYSISLVRGAKRYYGGLVGISEGTIENSYWCKALARVETSAGGEELTLEQMKKQESYVGFDFTSESPIWVMKEYPELNYKFGEK